MMKTTTESTPVPRVTSSKASDVVHRPAATKFQAKTALKPDDLRAVFDDTCARYPKTLARLAE